MSENRFNLGRLQLAWTSLTDVGRVRLNNEDCLIEAPDIGLFGVCDGLGGHAAGEVASALASKTVTEILRENSEEPQVALRRGMETANTRIIKQQLSNPDQQGMGTTLSLIWIQMGAAGKSWVAHIGDSRIYRLRTGELSQITSDHSPVYRLHQQGVLNKAQMRRHPQKNLLDRSLGISTQIEPDIFPTTLQSGDRILLCTDGLSDSVTDDEIQEILIQPSLDKAGCALLTDANEKGGLDNITLSLIEVVAAPE